MFKSKILKALALGLCMSALFTGAAYAQSTEGSSPSFAGTADAVDKLMYEKQSEIDAYLFVDHVKELEEKGIKVVYTAATQEYVEVAVAGLTDEQRDFLYESLGKDQVKIISVEEAQIYTTMVTEPAVAPDEVSLDDGDTAVIDKAELYADMPVASTAVDASEPVLEDKVYKGGDASVEAAAEEAGNLENPDVIFYTTADGVAEPGQEAELVYATGDAEAVKRGAEGEDKGLSTPLTILLIAGSAMVIGGAIMISNKKKTAK